MAAYWAWSVRPPRIHAWDLTEDQVQVAKHDGTDQTALCGFQGRIGERPTVRPFTEPEQNHCGGCWRKLHPRPTGIWEPALVSTSFYEIASA